MVAQMKPAIVLLLQMQTVGAANFTAKADRRCEAAKRKAAPKRPPTRKAEHAEKHGEQVCDAVQEQHQGGGHLQDKVRHQDGSGVFHVLHVRGFSAAQSEEHREDVLITFPSSKNQYHNSQSTLLKGTVS